MTTRELEAMRELAPWSTEIDQIKAELAAEKAKVARLEKEAENYRSVMIAAAEEIDAFWDAHCDAEGYGPANLMHRLERGIPAEYGYKVGMFNEMQKRIDDLTAQLAAKESHHIEDVRSMAEPVALPFAILPDELAALQRFHECAMDGDGYDVPEAMMRRLSEIGLLRHLSALYYEHSVFGLAVLNGEFTIPQPTPTTSSAVAAFRKKAAEVCKIAALKMEHEAQRAIEDGERDEVSSIRSTAWKLEVAAHEIAALPADESALREIVEAAVLRTFVFFRDSPEGTTFDKDAIAVEVLGNWV